MYDLCPRMLYVLVVVKLSFIPSDHSLSSVFTWIVGGRDAAETAGGCTSAFTAMVGGGAVVAFASTFTAMVGGGAVVAFASTFTAMVGGGAVVAFASTFTAMVG